jgi:hypothetical protein
MIFFSKVCDFIVDCKSGDDERSCGNCTFEGTTNPLCGWNDVSQGSLTWQRGKNGTLIDPNQGPTFDHTTYSSAGSFIYLTQGNGTIPDAPARLITPVLHEASSTCQLEFWMYINGLAANQINLTLLTGNQIERATLQRFHYLSTTNWTRVQVEIARVNGPFQIAFDSTRSVTWGWVAIDDITIQHCHFPPIVNPNDCQAADQFHCTRGSCIEKSRICDMTDDCGDHSDELRTLCASYQTCTFDISFCDWRHDDTAQFKWQLHQGPSPSDDTGVCEKEFFN